MQLFTFLSVSVRIPLLKSLTCEGEFSVIPVLRVNAPDGLELESVSHSAAAVHGVYESLYGRMRSEGALLVFSPAHTIAVSAPFREVSKLLWFGGKTNQACWCVPGRQIF